MAARCVASRCTGRAGADRGGRPAGLSGQAVGDADSCAAAGPAHALGGEAQRCRSLGPASADGGPDQWPVRRASAPARPGGAWAGSSHSHGPIDARRRTNVLLGGAVTACPHCGRVSRQRSVLWGLIIAWRGSETRVRRPPVKVCNLMTAAKPAVNPARRDLQRFLRGSRRVHFVHTPFDPQNWSKPAHQQFSSFGCRPQRIA